MSSRARLGNVTGALLLTHRGNSASDRASAGLVATSLDQLFDETLLVGGTPASDWPGARVADFAGNDGELRSLLAACEASSNERVLVAESDEAGCCSDLMLAVTAWPESDVVIVTDSDPAEVLCTLFRREVCTQVARAMLAAGEASRSVVTEAFARRGAAQEISVDRLGLPDWREDLPALGGAV